MHNLSDLWLILLRWMVNQNPKAAQHNKHIQDIVYIYSDMKI